MKRSVQEIIELAVFGLVALLIGTGILWLTGWAMAGLGWLLQLTAGLLWALLRFIVPVAVIAGLVYLLVRWLQGRARKPQPVVAAPRVEPDAPLPAADVTAEVRAVESEVDPYNPNDSWHPPAASQDAVVGDIVTEDSVVETDAAGAAIVLTVSTEEVDKGNADTTELVDSGPEAALPAVDSPEET